ncbi:FHIPEP family type III secretion protein [Streptomyces sp. V1I1]|uniref:FHIPEP family type III secretion protein n=1 Tax=Streptomyces sp. V1I1 TaxID=3042272 RepID=UPI00277F5E81|nr:FHIPEP family type III secretion protein [Streptomyces sp. V1I1]MDQ0939146.1 tetratricopeptide (TPR) repeat protein [Streptomyces sp. V1I1]
MTQPQDPVEGFPTTLFRELLRQARSLLSTADDRTRLRTSLRLAGPDEARQAQPANRDSGEGPDTQGDADDTAEHSALSAERAEEEGRRDDLAHVSRAYHAARDFASDRVFADALLRQVAMPDHLDAAVRLAHRAVHVLPEHEREQWDELVASLERLRARHRRRAVGHEQDTDLDTYRRRANFECVHHYSLTDEFIGREDDLRALEQWASDPEGRAVLCLCALGGGGKTAIAWQWINRVLAEWHNSGYRGAFWCSFYDKGFDFEAFLRRALVFCGGKEEATVRSMPRTWVEEELLQALARERFVLVIDGLERLMAAYTRAADRAIDEEGARAADDFVFASPAQRSMSDPRDGEFLRRLAGTGNGTKVLITTRLRPTELEPRNGQDARAVAEFHDVEGLNRDETYELWDSIVQDSPSDDVLDALFDLCGDHPLTVGVLAREVAESGGWTPWRAAHRDFDPEGPPARARAYIIGTSVRDLGEDRLEALFVLTMSGRPMLHREVAEALRFGSIADDGGRWAEPDRVDEVLDHLIKRGLIGRVREEDTWEYDVHPVVRGQMWEALTDTGTGRERFLGHALSELTAIPDPQRPLDLHHLRRAIKVYGMYAGAEQFDRAWELFYYRLWYPLETQGATRELLDLLRRLLPLGDLYQLPPLTSRRQQAIATGALADLLVQMGDGGFDRDGLGDVLLRWSGAIALRLGDVFMFLGFHHSRTWVSLYEGRLYETEIELRRLRWMSVRAGAFGMVGPIDLWIGIVLALRGEAPEGLARLDSPMGHFDSERWRKQTAAEGLLYANRPAEALQLLDYLTELGTDASEGHNQLAWEYLTRGVAKYRAGAGTPEELDEAYDDLATALSTARGIEYVVVQCFALTTLAQIRLDQDSVQAAADLVDQYFRLDPKGRYRLTASDAHRIHAECARRRGDIGEAVSAARKAYERAACDGPPFVYRDGLVLARALLTSLGASVPRVDAELPPEWATVLSEQVCREEEQSNALLARRRPRRRPAGRSRDTNEMILRVDRMARAGTDDDQRWWSDVTGDHSTITFLLGKTMVELGLTLADARARFERSAHRSIEVLYHELWAIRVLHPEEPRQAADASAEQRDAWLADTATQDVQLEAFLDGDRAKEAAHAFDAHGLDDKGMRVFLDDGLRRIGFANAPDHVRRWWHQAERRRGLTGANGLRDMLVIAECVQSVPATLAQFVDAISLRGAEGIEYAFRALDVARSTEQPQITWVSRVEGWPPWRILLRLQAVLYQLDWPSAAPEVRAFWRRLTSPDNSRLDRALHLAEEIALREGASLTDYHDAWLGGGTANIQAILCFLDYQRTKSAPAGEEPWSDGNAATRWPYDTRSPSFTDTSAWAADRIVRRLGQLKNRIGYGAASNPARAWWDGLEDRASGRAMVRLAEELDTRGETVDAFHLAHVDAHTDHPVATLAYLDFDRLRNTYGDTDAEAAAQLHNDIANRHYTEGDFDSAIDRYEAAIGQDPTRPVYYTNLAGAWRKKLDSAAGARKAIEVVRRGLDHCTEKSDLESELAQLDLWLRGLGRRDAGGDADSLASVVTPVVVELSRALQGDTAGLVARTNDVRGEIQATVGVWLPPVRYRGNDELDPGHYVIVINEGRRILGITVPGAVFVRSGGAARDPLDGASGAWVATTDDAAAPEGALSPYDFTLRHLHRAVLADTSWLREADIAATLEERWADPLDPVADLPLLAGFTTVVRAMLDDGVPVVAMEVLLDAYRGARDRGENIDEAIQSLRVLPGVRPQLPGNSPRGELVRLGDDLERILRSALVDAGDQHILVLDARDAYTVLDVLRQEFEDRRPDERRTLLTTDPLVRRYLRLLVRTEFPWLHVIADAELLGRRTVGRTVTSTDAKDLS